MEFRFLNEALIGNGKRDYLFTVHRVRVHGTDGDAEREMSVRHLLLGILVEC